MRKLTQRSEGGGRISSKQGKATEKNGKIIPFIYTYMDEDDIEFEELKVWLVNYEAKTAIF